MPKSVITRYSYILSALAACAAAGHSLSAMAQDVEEVTPEGQAEFERNRTTTVAGRVPPGYEAIGIPVGSFRLSPQVYLGAYFTDNIYVRETDKTSDVALQVAPSAALVSTWARHAVSVLVGASYDRYLRSSNENYFDYSAQADGRYDVGNRSHITGFVAWQRNTEKRGDLGAADPDYDPVQYTTLSSGLGASWESGRVRLMANGNYTRKRYSDTRDVDGSVISQGYRDVDTLGATLTGEYAITPNFALRVQASRENNDYTNSPLLGNRDFTTTELLAGASFEFTDFLRGEFGFGYIQQDYESAAFKSFDGVGGRAKLEYFPTQLTTITLNGARTVEMSGQRLSPSYLLTTVGLTVDHELYRNLIVSGSATYSDGRFENPRRNEHRYMVAASARYLINRFFSVNGRIEHYTVDSSPHDFGRNYNANSLTIGLTIKY